MWETLTEAEKKQVAELLAKWVNKLATDRLKITDDWDEFRTFTGSNGALWQAADTIRLENRAKAEAEAAKKQRGKK